LVAQVPLFGPAAFPAEVRSSRSGGEGRGQESEVRSQNEEHEAGTRHCGLLNSREGNRSARHEDVSVIKKGRRNRDMQRV
jgi:hypothetical protein